MSPYDAIIHIERQLRIIMSNITDLTANVGSLQTQLTAVSTSVSAIQAKLAAGSVLSPADQAALDAANTTLVSVTGSLQTLAGTIAAL
jgi:prefoldin subunit 5